MDERAATMATTELLGKLRTGIYQFLAEDPAKEPSERPSAVPQPSRVSSRVLPAQSGWYNPEYAAACRMALNRTTK
jgi:hypothetical protein